MLLTITLLFCSSVAGQEIIGPSEAEIRSDVWLSLELLEGSIGTFCPIETESYKVLADPARIAPNAAMFFAYVPGTYTVVAGINGEPGPTYTLLEIVVKGEGIPPTPNVAITLENVRKWLEEVPLLTRNEKFAHLITGEMLTRQEAVSQTFLSIGKAGPAIASIPGIDLMLSTALKSATGESNTNWQVFANLIDRGLAALKEQKVTAIKYADALTVVGEALTHD